MQQLNWYALYTKPRFEKKVNELLLKKEFESYCPLNKVTKQWKDRKKKVEIPLFTSYIFVKIKTTDYQAIRMTSGVVNFVYWLGKPAVIKDYEIEALKAFVDNESNIQLENIESQEGKIIEIKSGPFIGQKGKILNIKNRKVELKLESLNLILYVNI